MDVACMSVNDMAAIGVIAYAMIAYSVSYDSVVVLALHPTQIVKSYEGTPMCTIKSGGCVSKQTRGAIPDCN